MSKNLANQFYKYDSSPNHRHLNSISFDFCEECGSELIGNEPCLVCESKEKKQETKRKRNFRD